MLSAKIQARSSGHWMKVRWHVLLVLYFSYVCKLLTQGYSELYLETQNLAKMKLKICINCTESSPFMCEMVEHFMQTKC